MSVANASASSTSTPLILPVEMQGKELPAVEDLAEQMRTLLTDEPELSCNQAIARIVSEN